MNNAPPMVLELIGPQPPRGTQFCATCCVLYLGAVSSDELTQETARRITESAMKRGEQSVDFILPNVWHKKIREAVTTAPSVYYPSTPMPVCWSHMVGAIPQGGQRISTSSPLIVGKDYKSKRKAG